MFTVRGEVLMGRFGVSVACALVALAVVVRVTTGQESERLGVVDALDRGDLTAKGMTILAIIENATLRSNEEVRLALLRELERVTLEQAERQERRFRGERVPGSEGIAEYFLAVTHAVTLLEDPRSIEHLRWAADTGLRVQESLTRFGALAIPALADTWHQAASKTHLRADLAPSVVSVLARVAARPGELNSDTKRQVTEIATEALARPPSAFGLREGITLAVAVDDPTLIEDVGRLASSSAAVAARGVASPRDIQKIRDHAREQLEKRARSQAPAVQR